MALKPRPRKFALTGHIIFSVGWLGSVTSFMALAIAGLTSIDAQRVKAAYLAMELIGKFVIVPMCIATLITGLVLSLGTKWGLFRHYWILMKLLITIISTIALLAHMQPISYMARLATETTLSTDYDLRLQIQLVVAPSTALLALLVATILAVYKPRGLTPYGWRKQNKK